MKIIIIIMMMMIYCTMSKETISKDGSIYLIVCSSVFFTVYSVIFIAWIVNVIAQHRKVFDPEHFLPETI